MGALTAAALAASPAWWWLALGLALIGAEALAPGLFLLWFGLAALAMGAVAAFAPLPAEGQVALFAALAVAAALLGRRLARRRPDDAPHLGRRGEALVGAVLPLDEPIAGGVGRVRVADGAWRVAGPDLPAGARVRVVGVDGATLRVEAA